MLRRSLADAEGLSRDTKKEWAHLRSENIALDEMNVSGTNTHTHTPFGSLDLHLTSCWGPEDEWINPYFFQAVPDVSLGLTSVFYLSLVPVPSPGDSECQLREDGGRGDRPARQAGGGEVSRQSDAERPPKGAERGVRREHQAHRAARRESPKKYVSTLPKNPSCRRDPGTPAESLMVLRLQI